MVYLIVFERIKNQKVLQSFWDFYFIKNVNMLEEKKKQTIWKQEEFYFTKNKYNLNKKLMTIKTWRSKFNQEKKLYGNKNFFYNYYDENKIIMDLILIHFGWN